MTTYMLGPTWWRCAYVHVFSKFPPYVLMCIHQQICRKNHKFLGGAQEKFPLRFSPYQTLGDWEQGPVCTIKSDTLFYCVLTCMCVEHVETYIQYILPVQYVCTYIYYVHLLYCCTQKYTYMYIHVHATCILYILAYCVYMHVLLNLLSYIIFSTWCRTMLVYKRYTYRYVHTYICTYNAVICWSDGYIFLRLRCFLSSLLQWQDNIIMVAGNFFVPSAFIVGTQ